MPLIKSKSKKAMGENIATEMEAGKPQKQSIAIAYSVARHAKKKKMARGGMVDMQPQEHGAAMMEREEEKNLQASLPPASPKMQPSQAMDEMDADRHDLRGASNEHADSVASAIMRRKRMYAEGGMVDLKANAEEGANEADELNYEALGKENYSEGSGLEDLTSPEDSNEHGHSIDSDDHDMVSKLRSRMKSRRGF